MKSEKAYIDTEIVFMIILLLILVIIILGFLCNFCLDFEKGSHRIIPTAIDNDIWGNYKVYYKTTEFTKNYEEDFYYIDRDSKELANQMAQCIKNKQEVVVYYDTYVGFKGISHPVSSPIIKIEIVGEEK